MSTDPLHGAGVRQSKKVLVALSRQEADALFNLAVGMDDFIPEDHPVRTAANKLDEQVAAQMRDPYDVAKVELQDRLGYTLDQWQYDQLDFDLLAQAVVDRIVGIYE